MRPVKRLITPVLLLGLAFGAASGAGAADGTYNCPAQSSAQESPATAQQNRTMRMIVAMQNKDDAALSCAILNDRDLASYYYALNNAASSQKDPALVEKMLNLPVLDKDSPNYKKAVADVFGYVAANGSNATPEMARILFEPIKDDQWIKEDVLRFIFDTAVMSMPDGPNVEMTKLLINNGANAEVAYTQQARAIQHEMEMQRYKLDRLNKFKNEVLKP